MLLLLKDINAVICIPWHQCFLLTAINILKILLKFSQYVQVIELGIMLWIRYIYIMLVAFMQTANIKCMNVGGELMVKASSFNECNKKGNLHSILVVPNLGYICVYVRVIRFLSHTYKTCIVETGLLKQHVKFSILVKPHVHLCHIDVTEWHVLC